MNESLHARLDLYECTIVGNHDYLAFHMVAHLQVGIQSIPRMRAELLQTEGDATLLVVEVEDDNVDLLIELHHLVGIVDTAPREVCDVDQSDLNNKPAPFLLVVFAGAPLTQTIYGYLLMNTMKGKAAGADPATQMFLLGLGFACGLSMCMSALAQGRAGAAGSDALAETGKGFTNYIMVVGLCETIALFSMVFGMIAA